MATVTNYSKVDNAIQFAQKRDYLYMSYGKTSPWNSEDKAPSEVPSSVELPEIVGYAKVVKCELCKPIDTTEETNYTVIVEGKQRYAVIPYDKAYTEGATCVHLSFQLKGDEVPSVTYRQLGVYTNVEAKDRTASYVSKEELVNKGNLYAIVNKESPQAITKEILVDESFIISFDGAKTVL